MKTLNRIVLLLALLTVPLWITAQEKHSWERYFNELYTAGDDETGSWEEMYEELCDMEDHPININTATREDLEQLPFLTDKQIEDICEYIYRYGGMKTVGELQMIASLDYTRRHILQSFVYAGDDGKGDHYPSLKNIMKYGKSELMATAKIPLYDRKGDRNGYLGYKYKHWLRYDFSYGDYLKAGLVASQDAGEPMFAEKTRMGYDYYSLYMLVRKWGRLESLALGRYRLSFGMGLVMNTNFNMGKLAMLTNLGRQTNSIRAHSSRSESGYFQGAAASIKLTERITVSAFASYRPLDATLNSDDGTIATLLTTGYHRTPTEMEKKNNSHATAVGGNIRYFSRNGIHIGATAVYTKFDRKLKPKTDATYRRYYAAGNGFVNMSVDYGYVNHKISINGETAINRNGNMATINSVSVNLSHELNVMALQRFYSYRYTSLYAGSFCEGGAVQNESGVYVGVNWHPTNTFRLMAYTDYAHFAWPKYQVSQSSGASDNMVSVVYSNNRWTFDARYRLHIRQKDNQEKTALINRTEHRARIGAVYDGNKGWSCRMQADFSFTEYKQRDKGWMISENVNYKHKWLQMNLSGNYFNTDSYESRLYAYERGTMYNFSFPMFYGEGVRYALMARAKVNGNLTLTAKIGVTDYFDRATIGSSYQTVYGSSVADVDVQLRWLF